MFGDKNILLVFTTRSTVIPIGTDNSEYKIRFRYKGFNRFIKL